MAAEARAAEKQLARTAAEARAAEEKLAQKAAEDEAAEEERKQKELQATPEDTERLMQIAGQLHVGVMAVSVHCCCADVDVCLC